MWFIADNNALAQARHIEGYPVGLIGNNGMLFSESAIKVTRRRFRFLSWFRDCVIAQSILIHFDIYIYTH